jgi:colanic acid/amylovoran biosynthesis protein
MTIELRGINFFNKGSELMLQAVMCKVKEEIPDALFVMEKTQNTPRAKHLENGIYTKANFKKILSLKYLFTLVPGFIRRRWKYINETEINIVLDCSGFAFGDIWGVKGASRLMDNIIEWKKQGKKVIMLPQAFGPFSDSKLSSLMRDIIHYADLIYARDKDSLKHLKQLNSDNRKINCAPDFTNLIEGNAPAYFDSLNCEVAIVVNSKMVSTVSTKEAQAYLDLVYKIIIKIRELNHKPYFLMHEVKMDPMVVEAINDNLTNKLPVINEADPLYIKGMILKSKAVVTSRFHGLISCLSQAIPCLATSWSHKYEMLLKDYNYSEALLNVYSDDELLSQKVNSILTEPWRSMIIEKLTVEGVKQKQLSNEMWHHVFEQIRDIQHK